MLLISAQTSTFCLLKTEFKAKKLFPRNRGTTSYTGITLVNSPKNSAYHTCWLIKQESWNSQHVIFSKNLKVS